MKNIEFLVTMKKFRMSLAMLTVAQFVLIGETESKAIFALTVGKDASYDQLSLKFLIANFWDEVNIINNNQQEITDSYIDNDDMSVTANLVNSLISTYA